MATPADWWTEAQIVLRVIFLYYFSISYFPRHWIESIQKCLPFSCRNAHIFVVVVVYHSNWRRLSARRAYSPSTKSYMLCEKLSDWMDVLFSIIINHSTASCTEKKNFDDTPHTTHRTHTRHLILPRKPNKTHKLIQLATHFSYKFVHRVPIRLPIQRHDEFGEHTCVRYCVKWIFVRCIERMENELR